MRLHALAQQSLAHSLPYPVYFQVHTASEHDLEALRAVLEQIENRLLVLDKAYCDKPLARMCQQNNSYLFTPEKQKKGEGEWDRIAEQRQQHHAYRKALSTTVATLRQPIESFFHWINDKTKI
ncbi:MAG: transposase [Bacteroidota bacterium]